MTRLPRLVVAAPATGQGKTTVATGLMAALTRAGHIVSGAQGRAGLHRPRLPRPGERSPRPQPRPHLVGEERIVPLLLHGAAGADVAVVEGVMGLYDGRVGGEGFSSTAHVATLTRSPVVLVVDISRSSRSIGAVVHGMRHLRPSRRGRRGDPQQGRLTARHAQEVAGSIDLPVLGTIGRDDAFAAPSRHLGLVPAAERDEAALALDRLADHVAADGRPGGGAADRPRRPRPARRPVGPPAARCGRPRGARPVVAMAGGRAFTFRYAETEELLRAAGCEVVTFDPLTDRSLPVGTGGVYLGGGFPEVHAVELTANAALREDLRVAVAEGVPTVAECAGLLYLCGSVDDAPMVGAIAAEARMTPRLTLRYPTASRRHRLVADARR